MHLLLALHGRLSRPSPIPAVDIDCTRRRHVLHRPVRPYLPAHSWPNCATGRLRRSYLHFPLRCVSQLLWGILFVICFYVINAMQILPVWMGKLLAHPFSCRKPTLTNLPYQGPCCWIYASEIPTARLRSLNVALAAATQWLFNFVVAKSVPTMLATVGSNGYG